MPMPAQAPEAAIDGREGMSDMAHDLADMKGTDDMTGMDNMTGVLGSYPMNREASGTSWQPDSSVHMGGVSAMRGDWMLMGHAMIYGVYEWQEGPRGDEKSYVYGMLMGTARRDFERGTLNLRAMISPDPFMGKSGYPLLLAAGETADGVTPLVDRQHPHELLMELSASYSYKLSDRSSVFVYGGLPGEPAFGPPAFMHRASAMDSPEAPITHHWFDSTHITFGVLTAGYVQDNWKLEASRFKGREPDENRYDIDDPKLDSTSFRASWNPTPNLALQGSWADLKSPEQLEPDKDETRYSVSGAYTVPLGEGRSWATTLAWGLKQSDEDLNGYAAETAFNPVKDWTIFARAERVEQDELLVGGVDTVTKASIGAIRDFKVSEFASIGIGGLYSYNWVPDRLAPSYGGDPAGAMAFVRLRIGS